MWPSRACVGQACYSKGFVVEYYVDAENGGYWNKFAVLGAIKASEGNQCIAPVTFKELSDSHRCFLWPPVASTYFKIAKKDDTSGKVALFPEKTVHPQWAKSQLHGTKPGKAFMMSNIWSEHSERLSRYFMFLLERGTRKVMQFLAAASPFHNQVTSQSGCRQCPLAGPCGCHTTENVDTPHHRFFFSQQTIGKNEKQIGGTDECKGWPFWPLWNVLKHL